MSLEDFTSTEILVAISHEAMLVSFYVINPCMKCTPTAMLLNITKYVYMLSISGYTQQIVPVPVVI